MTILESFDDYNQLFYTILQPKLEQYLDQPDTDAQLVLSMPNIPQIVFENLVYGNRSINWNKTQLYPVAGNNQMANFTAVVDYFVCNFSYIYGVKNGTGSLYMQNVSVSLLMQFDVITGPGLGLNVSIPVDPVFSYSNLTFTLYNQTDLTNGVNQVCGMFPSLIVQNVVSGIRSRIPSFINSLLDNDVWGSSSLLANILFSYQVRLVDIQSVQLTDQSVTKNFINITLYATTWTNATVS